MPKQVWCSQFIPKCLWYAFSVPNFICNFRTLLWRVGAKGYPTNWWRPILWGLFQQFQLQKAAGYLVICELQFVAARCQKFG